MKIEFTKMHGLGNDYIYVNTMKYPLTNLEEKVHSLESSSYGG